MKTSKSWIGRFNKNNPRIVMFILFVILLLPSLFIGDKYIKTTEERYEETKRELIKRSEEYKISAETWKEKYEKIKKSSKVVKIVKPDGTVIETTEEQIESDTSITESIKQEMEAKIKEEKETLTHTLEAKFEKLIKEKKKLNLSIGLFTDVNDIVNISNPEYYLHGSYNFLGPFSISGQITNKGKLGIGVGICF